MRRARVRVKHLVPTGWAKNALGQQIAVEPWVPTDRKVFGVAPVDSTEPLAPAYGNRVIAEQEMYTPEGVYRHQERVEIRGQLFEISGDPADWMTGRPRQRRSFPGGYVVPLRKVTDGPT